MAVCKNDYSKEEDLAMWVLHDIRHKMVERGLSVDAINKSARDFMRKRRFSSSRLVKPFQGV